MEGILAQMERNEKSEERRALDANMGKLSNVLPAYDHIPGKRGSGGIWARGGEKEFGVGFGMGAPDPDRLIPIPNAKPPRSSQIMDQQ
jgi:hypothetical protein